MPRPAKPAAKNKKPNPYLGFGWVGWVGVVVIVVLAIAAMRGWDPVYQLLWYVSFSLEQNPLLYWSNAFACAQLWTYGQHLSIENGLIVAAILFWASRCGTARLGWAITLGILSVLLPFLWYGAILAAPDRGGASILSRVEWYIVVEIAMTLIPIAIVYVATRTVWLTTAWCAMFAVGWYRSFTWFFPWPRLTMDLYGLAWFAWQIVFVGISFAWAILAVRRLPGEHQCPKCLYDMTNLPTTTCPECGEDVSVVVSLES